MFRLIHSQPLVPGGPFVNCHHTSSHIMISDRGGSVHVLSANGQRLYMIKSADPNDNPRKCVSVLTTAIDHSDGGEELIVAGTGEGQMHAYSLTDGSLKFIFPTVHEHGISRILNLEMITRKNEDVSSYRILSTDYRSGLIVVWDLAKRTVIYRLEGHTYGPSHISVLPDETTLITGSYDGTIRLWDLTTGKESRLLQIPEDKRIEMNSNKYSESVSAMLLVPKGRILAGGIGGFVRVWDVKSGSLLATWQAHFGGIPQVGPVLNNIIMHPSGKAFVTTGTDGVACVWDLETYARLRCIHPLEHAVMAVTFFNNILVCGGKDGGGKKDVCGLWSKTVTWDLSQLELKEEIEENYEQLGALTEMVRRAWQQSSNLVVVGQKGDRCIVDIWGLQEM